MREHERGAMADTYSVLYTGQLKPDVDLEQAVAAFAARFGVQPAKVRDIFEAGREVMLKSDLSADQARQYRHALERIGLIVRTDPFLQEEEVEGQPQPGVPEPAAEAATTHDPFQPPKANLEEAWESGDFHEPVSVPASHGWRWLKEGFLMVFASPVAWIGTVLIWTILNIVLNFIPVVNFLAALIMAVFMGGIMLGAYEQDNGGRFTIGHLFAGFSNKFGPLFLVGILYMVGMIALVLIMFLVMGGLFSATANLSGPESELAAELFTSPVIWLPVLVAAALVIPMAMAYWFAPVLVALDDVSALSAMGMSFRACLKNILPFLLYGLIALVLFILGSIPLFLGLLIVIPGIVASVYTGYRDIFRR